MPEPASDSSAPTNNRPTNWAGNHTFGARRIVAPESVDALQEVVAQSSKVKALGARHSFNHIADAADTLISLANLPATVEVDAQSQTATVGAGLTYGEFCARLHEQAYAIHNMASLPHITLGGAIATATHGSGDANGNLARAVAGLELVTATGELVHITRGAGEIPLAGAVVSLGALGVVTRVTLDVQPAFDMQQAVYERLPFAELCANFDAIMGSAYSVSLFTDWQSEHINQLWIKRRVDPDGTSFTFAPDCYGAQLAQMPMHPSGRSSPASCTPQLGGVGPWHERLPHFRVDHTPASGNELQSEYFVPRAHAVDALRAVADLRSRLQPVLIISEVRTVAADDLWLSQAYGQDCVGIHFSLQNDWPAVRAVLPDVEAALAPFAPRPHWGKLFTMAAPELQARYPRLDDFRRLVAQLDPAGKFHNDYLDQIL